MGNRPADILTLEPWNRWFTTPIEDGHWGLSEEAFRDVASAQDWGSAYGRIIEACPLFREGETLIVDKSPRYLQDLDVIMAKVPGTPCLVLEKDALLMYHSYQRRGFDLKRFTDYFNQCQQALERAETSFEVKRISQQRLSENQSEVFEELCEMLGLDYEEKYVTRAWCKRNMYGISFIWLFKKPYDYQSALMKAREEVDAEDIAYLKDNLYRPENRGHLFEALDAS